MFCDTGFLFSWSWRLTGGMDTEALEVKSANEEKS